MNSLEIEALKKSLAGFPSWRRFWIFPSSSLPRGSSRHSSRHSTFGFVVFFLIIGGFQQECHGMICLELGVRTFFPYILWWRIGGMQRGCSPFGGSIPVFSGISTGTRPYTWTSKHHVTTANCLMQVEGSCRSLQFSQIVILMLSKQRRDSANNLDAN